MFTCNLLSVLDTNMKHGSCNTRNELMVSVKKNDRTGVGYVVPSTNCRNWCQIRMKQLFIWSQEIRVFACAHFIIFSTSRHRLYWRCFTYNFNHSLLSFSFIFTFRNVGRAQYLHWHLSCCKIAAFHWYQHIVRMSLQENHSISIEIRVEHITLSPINHRRRLWKRAKT